ncbi:hypothetical protein BDV93DRAFT_521003 [Ceratobasidium sp. AG-I]|nr:hypothetical protein BDV93DRAFT_521003 [Ceratobasidium sp. AG-I]
MVDAGWGLGAATNVVLGTPSVWALSGSLIFRDRDVRRVRSTGVAVWTRFLGGIIDEQQA